MRSLEIRIDQGSFADTLGAMREWLDREKCYLSHFRHKSDDGGMVIISVGFLNGDDPRVDAFHRQFGGISVGGGGALGSGS
jgi:hypothetical protein